MIDIQNLYKYYPTALGRKYVFKDMSIKIPEMCNVGVLGLNGSGKSTLINLLSGSDQPNSGSIKINGSVSWPLGLSGGAQPRLTGRQNAEFVCRIYCSSRKEIQSKLEFIKDFSDIGDFFELPVRTYSSGMRSKLTFAMSMAFNFDIYLIDELTAVGDAQFRKKSQEALRAKRNEAYYIMVSHNVNDLIKDCDQMIVLHKGEVTLFEDVKRGLEYYKKKIKVKEKEPAQ